MKTNTVETSHLDNNSQPAPLMVSVKQAMSLLGLGKNTVYSLVKDGTFTTAPGIKRNRRIPMSQIHAYVKRAEENRRK